MGESLVTAIIGGIIGSAFTLFTQYIQKYFKKPKLNFFLYSDLNGSRRLAPKVGDNILKVYEYERKLIFSIENPSEVDAVNVNIRVVNKSHELLRFDSYKKNQFLESRNGKIEIKGEVKMFKEFSESTDNKKLDLFFDELIKSLWIEIEVDYKNPQNKIFKKFIKINAMSSLEHNKI